MKIPAEIRVIDFFGDLDPPPLPLTGPHEVGLAQILRRIASLDRDLAKDTAADRLIGLLGGHTPWER